MWNKVVSRGKLSAVALFLSLPGCTAISDCKYEVSQKIRTCQAWHEFDGCQDECFTCDYQSGWKAGYYDVVTGGTGCPPVIAPKKYWKAPVVFEHDPRQRNDWYCGFQDGAACAKCQPDFHYLQTFMPPAASCRPHCVSHHDDSSGQDQFPSEQLSSPNAVVPVEKVAPVETAPTAGAPSTPESLPETSSDGPAPVTPENPEQDYNKDPEPSGAQSDGVPVDFISRELVRVNGSMDAGGPSLLEQLVFNASQAQGEDSGADAEK